MVVVLLDIFRLSASSIVLLVAAEEADGAAEAEVGAEEEEQEDAEEDTDDDACDGAAAESAAGLGLSACQSYVCAGCDRRLEGDGCRGRDRCRDDYERTGCGPQRRRVRRRVAVDVVLTAASACSGALVGCVAVLAAGATDAAAGNLIQGVVALRCCCCYCGWTV